jgi:hypothetical protein
MSERLSDGENLSIAAVAAVATTLSLQPTLYWKTAAAHGLQFTLNPRVVYRGTGASLANEVVQMGSQFVLTGFAKRTLVARGGALADASSTPPDEPARDTSDRCAGHPEPLVAATDFSPTTAIDADGDLLAQEDDEAGVPPLPRASPLEHMSASMLGGAIAALLATPIELLMIHQQINGGSLRAALRATAAGARARGVPAVLAAAGCGVFRGLGPTMARDAGYVGGMLGVTPVLQQLLDDRPSLLDDRPSLPDDRPSLLDDRPSLALWAAKAAEAEAAGSDAGEATAVPPAAPARGVAKAAAVAVAESSALAEAVASDWASAASAEAAALIVAIDGAGDGVGGVAGSGGATSHQQEGAVSGRRLGPQSGECEPNASAADAAVPAARGALSLVAASPRAEEELARATGTPGNSSSSGSSSSSTITSSTSTSTSSTSRASSLLASVIGGSAGALVSHPWDVIKTSMQGDLNGTRFGRTPVQVARAIVRERGLSGLFAGCSWRTLNIVTSVFIVNECFLRLAPRR